MTAVRAPQNTLRDFAVSVLQKAKVAPEQAECTADILVWSDLIGRGSQGVWRLPILCKRTGMGILNGRCQPQWTRNAAAVESVNGDNGLGHYVGHVAMARAMELAKKNGCGMVGVTHSNYYGAGAYYVQMAAQQEMIGLAFSNSFPKVAAHGGYKPVFGTNPMAFGAPSQDGHSLLVDMATAQSAGSTVRKYQEANKPMPEGIAVDAQGKPITDPFEIEKGTILPAGGARGYGLALLVEILSGVLTGAGFSHHVKSLYKDFEHGGNNGNLLIAIDIKQFLPLQNYYQKLNTFLALLHGSTPTDPERKVLYPGELRWEEHDHNQQHGIPLDKATKEALEKLGKELEVRVPW
ncbi:MAG: Ldh family oxidoreductase [Gammaproteobacteria bacterium]|nr:Ldh family oxidoreductase [Gammaproteobacteria bacterium]